MTDNNSPFGYKAPSYYHLQQHRFHLDDQRRLVLLEHKDYLTFFDWEEGTAVLVKYDPDKFQDSTSQCI